MLAPVTLAEQWREIEASLAEGWTEAQVTLTLAEDERADQAALLLTPFSPGRTGSAFRLRVERWRNPGRVFGRLDEEGIRGRIDLVTAEKRTPAAAPARHERSRPLAKEWDDLVERLPPDWSDLYAEVEFDSSDYLQRAALLLAPVNPARYGGARTLRFRVARVSGYGAAQTMARRCLERLDAEGITGRLHILRAQSATSHVATQGPVWRIGGRSV